MLITKLPVVMSGTMHLVHENERLIINDLWEALLEENIELINNRLHIFEDDVRGHFKFEENLMKDYMYPNLKEHTAIHNTVTIKLGDAVVGWKRNMDIESLKKYLKDDYCRWFVDHLESEDNDTARFLESRGVC